MLTVTKLSQAGRWGQELHSSPLLPPTRCCSQADLPRWDTRWGHAKPEPCLHHPSSLPPQVLHFFVGFGALLSPLIADPFLSEANCLPANSTANATSVLHASRVLGRQHPEAQPWSNRTLPGLPSQDGAGTRVSYAFWIMALINVSAPGQGWVRASGQSPTSPYQLPVQILPFLRNGLGLRCAFRKMGEPTPRDES